MKSKMIRTLRVPSLTLAAALQVLPLARAALPAAQTTVNVLTIIFRWAVGAAAVGAVDAVSGASTVVTNPLSTNIVQGKPFTLRLITAPHQAFYWTATGLPAGLSVNGTPGQAFWQILGTPTVSGNYNVGLTASDHANYPASHTASATLMLHISGGGNPPLITSPPPSLTVTQGQSAGFSVTASGTTNLSYQWRFNGTNLAGKTDTNLVINPATTNNAGGYTVVITNNYGSVTSTVAALTVVTVPVITTQPQSQTNLVGTGASFSVAATSAGPLTYQWRKDGPDLSNTMHLTGSQGNSLAIGGTLTNDAGNYAVVVANAAGSVTSQVAVLTVIVPPPVFAPLTVTVSGLGSVSPDYNEQSLQIGAGYTMAAIPGPGYYFTNWTGGISANTAALSFTMRSNLVLQANFVAIPFPFVKGTYNGLYYDANGATVSNSGAFTITTTTAGKYSAALLLAGKKYSFAGQFNNSGLASNSVSPSKSNALAIALVFDRSDMDHLTGSVSNAFGFAQMAADRALFNVSTNPASQAGSYTFVIHGLPGNPGSPGGDSYGTLKVDGAGKISLAGLLADGTKVTQSAFLSKNGDWPLYLPLYSGAGLVLSWQLFTNSPTDDISGPVSWIKAPQPKAKYFPGGFACIVPAIGSKFLAPASGVPAINLQDGNLWVTDGGLAQSYTNLITLLPNNNVTNLTGTKLTLTVSPKTGLFSGSFVNPETTKTVAISGVVLQKQNTGAGFFLGTNLSGQVYFNP